MTIEIGSYENIKGYYIELKDNESILISRYFETKKEINNFKNQLKENYNVGKVIENY